MKYIIHSTIMSIEKRINKVWVKGIGEEAVFKDKDCGWFILLRGSYEALHVGYEEPMWRVGDHVKITLERSPE